MTESEPSVVIRPARRDDVEAIHELLLANCRRGELLLLPRRIIARRIHDFAAAELERSIVGCVARHRHCGHTFEICSLSVLRAFQGRGIGSSLLRFVLRECRKDDLTFLVTEKPGFYRKFGFEEMDVAKVPLRVWIKKTGILLVQPLHVWKYFLKIPYVYLRFGGS